MLDQLAQLRIELVDRAYLLDRHGRADAADLAAEVAGRLGELLDEIKDGECIRINSSATCPENAVSSVEE